MAADTLGLTRDPDPTDDPTADDPAPGTPADEDGPESPAQS